MQVLLHEHLGHVVADLRPHHRDGAAVGRVGGVDELPVGCVRRAREGLAQQLRADRAVVGDRGGVRRVGGHGRVGEPRRARGGRGDARGARSCHFFADVDEADAPRVGHRESSCGEWRSGLVREAGRDRDRRLGVIVLAEGFPRRPAPGCAELFFKRLQSKSRAHLRAAALAEDPADQ